MRHFEVTSVLFFLIGVFSLTNCVSVNIGPGKSKKAEGLIYSQPPAPFKKIDNATVDQAWQSEKNGNTIGFLSDCNSKAEMSLKSMESESLAALTNLRIIESKEFLFNDREGLRTTAEGRVDGVPVQLTLTIFKKNGCNYTLSYVGRKKYFEEDRSLFENFRTGFHAP